MATVYSVTWICRFKSPNTQLAQVRMIKRRERHIDRLNSREDTWKCTRIEDTLKSRDICIFTLVVVFRRLWYFETLGRQHPNSPIAKGFQLIFYAKLYIFSSFKWTRNLHGLQPLNPECTSFSPDRLNTEPQPPLKMFRCDDETFRLTLDHIKDIPNHRDKWRTP